MTIDIKNQVYLKISIDGTEIPIDLGNITAISVASNIQNKVPQLDFTMNDPSNLLIGIVQLSDGSTIDVTLHSNNPQDAAPPEVCSFLTTGIHLATVGSKLVWTVSAIYNAPTYLGATASSVINSTSSDAISKLAQVAGLFVKSVDATNDSQVWRPTRQTISDFVHHIADHGFVDSNSVMSVGVTDTGGLLYKNIQSLITQFPSKVVMSGSPEMANQTIIPCLSYSVTSIHGLTNFTQNYGVSLLQEKLDGTTQIFGKYAATLFGQYLNLSAKNKSKVNDLVRKEHLPMASTNVHENFYQAEYQNRRGKGLFNNKINFITLNSSGLNLYDVFMFIPTLPTNNKVADSISGNYIITAKKKYLAGGRYYEMLEGNSQQSLSGQNSSLIGQ